MGKGEGGAGEEGSIGAEPTSRKELSLVLGFFPSPERRLPYVWSFPHRTDLKIPDKRSKLQWKKPWT